MQMHRERMSGVGSMIYFGGDILTMEDAQTAEAVLTEDGIIKKVGSYSQVIQEKTAETALYDLKGRTLLPGFIDAHSHLSAYAKTLAYVDLSGAGSFEEIKTKLLTFQKDTRLPENMPLIGFGYDHNSLREKRHPDKQLLDSLAVPNPVLISHVSGHMGVLSSKALSVLSITRETKEAPGGKIGRIPGSSEPNGYLEEAVYISAAGKLSSANLERDKKLIEEAQKKYAGFGITTVQDGLLDEAAFSLLKESKLFLDVVGYLDIKKCPGLLQAATPYYGQYRDHLKIGGIKLILDGSPQGRTAWMTEPYEHAEDGYLGYPVYQDAEVIAMMKEGIRKNLQILAHANGDAAAEQMIRCYETAKQEAGGPADRRPVMIHAQFLRTDLLKKVKALGMIPSYFTAHTYYWGDIHKKNLGKRAERISPAASSARLGIPFTFHQDTPVLPPDMLKTIWCAVNRKTKEGRILGKEECIRIYAALEAVTIHAAHQYFEETKKGSICAGKEANFVILSENPLQAAKEKLDQIQVLETRIRDQVIFQR